MKTIRNFLIGLVVLFALLLIIAFFLPSKKHVEGSVVAKAPAYLVFNQVNNFTNWEKWSPWAVGDSLMVSTYEGSVSGVGAITKWTSPNKRTGNGSMEISGSEPYKSLQIELNMMDQESSKSPWTFEETPEGTKVTWGLDMQNMNLLERYVGLFFQKMMDPYFKQGLDSLKSVSERLAVQYPGKVGLVEVTDVPSGPAFSIIDSATMQNMSLKMAGLYGELIAYIKLKNLESTAPPYCIYHKWDPSGNIVFEAGIPIATAASGKGRIKSTQTPSGKAVTVLFRGPYSGLTPAYEMLDQYIKNNNMVVTGGPWEVCTTGPQLEPDSLKWETHIYFPVK